MVKRPTMPDLARAAGVSVATVNRVINDPGKVRESTRERVYHAAQEIGFYGLGSVDHSLGRSQEVHRLGIVLNQRSRTFYHDLGQALQRTADEYRDGRVELSLMYLDDLSPESVATRLLSLGKECESVALVAAEHPLVSNAIDELLARNVAVSGLIAPLTARGNVSFIGLDNWKVGRTAAWAFDKIVRSPGKIGILIGNHRYRNQDLNESGFRSYFREHASGFTLLEPLTTFESASVARELTEELFLNQPDLCGLFISGGGVTGALAALREVEQRDDFVAVGYELFETTRAALIDGTLTMVISHPMDAFARETIATMVKAKQSGPGAGAQNVLLDFDIYTSENV